MDHKPINEFCLLVWNDGALRSLVEPRLNPRLEILSAGLEKLQQGFLARRFQVKNPALWAGFFTSAVSRSPLTLSLFLCSLSESIFLRFHPVKAA
jgi:hypothetical protein